MVAPPNGGAPSALTLRGNMLKMTLRAKAQVPPAGIFIALCIYEEKSASEFAHS